MKQDWEIKKLGSVCEVNAGQSPKSKYYNSDQNGLPFYQGKKEFSEKYIGEPTKWTTKTTKKAYNNDILMSVRAPVGPINFSKQKICIGRGLAAIRAGEFVDKEFLFNFLLKHENEIIGNAGAVFNSINKKQIEDINIPLPSLPEQKRIAAILNKAFAAMAKAKANAEQNLKNAKELFESYLQGVFENKGEGWKFTKLKHNIDLLTGFAFKSKYYTNNKEDIFLLRGDNIMQGKFRWKDAKRWKKSEYYDFAKYQLQENDIVLAMDRPWVKAGLKCARVSRIDLPSLLVQRTACLRNNSKINSSFLYYLIKSKGFMDYLLDVQTGIGVPHISGKQILGFTFNRPPINKQKFIVKKLNALSAETKKLGAIYQQKIDDLEELKKSVLKKAFNGEL